MEFVPRKSGKDSGANPTSRSTKQKVSAPKLKCERLARDTLETASGTVTPSQAYSDKMQPWPAIQATGIAGETRFTNFKQRFGQFPA